MTKLRKKWIAALRSGKYKQTRGRLKNHTGYCCLGVLCDVAGLKFKRDAEGDIIAVFNGISFFGIPPHVITDQAGLNTDEVHELIDMNDTLDADFNEIADLLEMAP